jgi:hypothetical protein
MYQERAYYFLRIQWAFSGSSCGVWPGLPIKHTIRPSSAQSACTKKQRFTSYETNGHILVHLAEYGRPCRRCEAACSVSLTAGGALGGVPWNILAGMAGPTNGVRLFLLACSMPAGKVVYQETLCYFLRNLMGVFWYILLRL